MGEDFDLGLGLAIGGCEFKPVLNHDKKHLQGKHKSLVPPLMKEKTRDQENGIISKSEGTDIKRLKVEDGFLAKDSSDSVGDDSSGSNIRRKKLSLTKEQSSLLEESFRMKQILSSKQKNELAQKLNLKPRQVEVWFQNRRARTKLKQTEVDCEYLKRRCESLTCENVRLKRELLELRLIKARAASYNDQNFHASEVMKFCPLCEKIN